MKERKLKKEEEKRKKMFGVYTSRAEAEWLKSTAEKLKLTVSGFLRLKIFTGIDGR